MDTTERCNVVREKRAITTAGDTTITNTFRVDFTACTWDDVVNMAVRTAIINRQQTMRKRIGKYRDGAVIDVRVNVSPTVDPVDAFAAYVAAMAPAKRRALFAAMADEPTLNVRTWSDAHDDDGEPIA